MHMHIDETGQAGLVAEVEQRHGLRNFRVASRNCVETSVADDDHTVVQHVIGQSVDQGTTTNEQIAAIGFERYLGDLRWPRLATKQTRRQQRRGSYTDNQFQGVSSA